MSTIIQTYKYTIPANGQIPINTTGWEVRCFRASGQFRLRIEPYGEMPMEQQVSFRAPRDPFTRLVLINDTANNIDVTLLIANGQVQDGRVSIDTNNAIPVDINSLPPAPPVNSGGFVQLNGIAPVPIAPVNQNRKELIVQNVSASPVLITADPTGGAHQWVLQTFQTERFPFRDDFTAQMTSAIPGKVNVIEG